MPDHVHIGMSISPKIRVSFFMGYEREKLALRGRQRGSESKRFDAQTSWLGSREVLSGIILEE